MGQIALKIEDYDERELNPSKPFLHFQKCWYYYFNKVCHQYRDFICEQQMFNLKYTTTKMFFSTL